MSIENNTMNQSFFDKALEQIKHDLKVLLSLELHAKAIKYDADFKAYRITRICFGIDELSELNKAGFRVEFIASHGVDAPYLIDIYVRRAT
jgi:hypothetical protein